MDDDDEDSEEYSEDDENSESESEADEGNINAMGMAYEKSTVSAVRMAATMLEEKLRREEEVAAERLVDPGMRQPGAAENVRRLLAHRFGCCTRGWRDIMDRRGVHRVGRADFFTALRDLGFHGDGKAAWCELTGATLREMASPKMRQITLADIDAEAAKLLSDFYRTYNEEIGKLPGLFKKSDGMRVGESQFLERCKVLGSQLFDRPAIDLKAVFKSISSHGAVTMADVDWLTDYCLREKPERPGPLEPTEEYREGRAKAARARALQAFRELIQHKYGSLVAGWRKVLDPEAQGEITAGEFQEAAERLHFKGSVADVWDALVFDRGHSKTRFPREDDEDDPPDDEEDEYSLHLGDLEPSVVECITAWQGQCVDRYGSMVKAFEGMESEKKPLVTKEEFSRFCNEIRFNHNKHLLWEVLDEKGVGAVLLSDLDEKAASKAFAEDDIRIAAKMHRKMAQVEKGRISLRQRAAKQCAGSKKAQKPEKSSLNKLMGQLERRFESPVRAWSRLLDMKNKGKVKTDEFLVGCAAVGFRGSRTKLLKELELESGSSVRFKALAPDVIEECKSFKLQAEGKIGNVVKAIEAETGEKKKSGLKLKRDKFAKICKRIGYEGDPQKIFTHLDVGADGTLNTKLLKTMDPSGKEDKVVSNVMKKHHEGKQKQLQQTLTEKAVPPVQQLKLKQDGLLAAGREKRGKKTDAEARKKEFLRHLEKNVGSVARAWRLAFDPDNRGEVEAGDFVAGCQRSGFVDTSASQEELDKTRQLYDLLADEETGAVTLEILDPKTTQALYEFRCRLAGRYGGVKQAFLEFDPSGSGLVSSQAFRHMCHEAKMTDGIRRLLEYLDPNDQDEIQLEFIDEEAAEQAKDISKGVLEARQQKKEIDARKGRNHMKKAPPPVGVPVGVKYRKQERAREAGQRVLGELKRRLVRQHGTLVRAWQKVFKPAADQETKTVTFNVFEGICKAVGMEGDAQAAWDAMDLEGDGLTLTELDPGIEADFRELLVRASERYGNLAKAFDEIDEDGSFELDKNGFFNFCYECQFRRNERRLFAYLDSENRQRISLESIDSHAVEAAKLIREKEAEARAVVDGTTATDGGGSESSGTPTSRGSKPARPDKGDAHPVARAFREQLQRRFGSMIRAWRMIDIAGKVALTKQEFIRAVQTTGYSGNASFLWKSLGLQDDSLMSLRELDPEVFWLLSSFRELCGHYGGLEKAFTESNASTSNRLSREEFFALCKKVRLAKETWKTLFEQLDVRSAGMVTWEEVRFLEDHWDWDEEEESEPKPIRNPNGTRTLPTELPGSPKRAGGLGHMCMSMRPRVIGGMKKSSSLPAISPSVRDNWNDRHQILDTRDNKDTQLLHLVTCVLTKDRERIKRKVAQKMVEVPTMQWLEENMPAEDEDDEEGYDEGYDEDY